MTQSQKYAPSYSIKVNNTDLLHGTTIDVTSVSVTETINQADSFNISIRDRSTDPTRIFAGGDALVWMDSDVFDEGNEVKIEMGYVNNMKLMLVGEITGVSSSFPSSGQPTLTVRGQSLFHRLYRERRREPFASGTDSDMAKAIASTMNLKADIHDTPHEHAMIASNGETLGAILRRRASRLNFETTVKERTLVFQRPGYLDHPSATLTMEWGRDLISFSPSTSTHNQYTQVNARSVQTSIGRGKSPLVGTAAAGDVQTIIGDQSGQQIAQQRFGEHVVLIEDHEIDSQEEANDVAQASLQASSMGYLKGNGSCVGNPELTSRTMVELKGLGTRFSGLYYVTSTTHTINSSGYLTNFSVQRNGR